VSTRLGPILIDCDAPPYAIVQACERRGLRSPLDVRWCRGAAPKDKAFDHTAQLDKLAGAEKNLVRK